MIKNLIHEHIVDKINITYKWNNKYGIISGGFVRDDKKDTISQENNTYINYVLRHWFYVANVAFLVYLIYQ